MYCFFVWLQLHNIQNIIQLTKEYIDDLNSRFAGFQHPPSLYLTVRLFTAVSKFPELRQVTWYGAVAS